MYDSVSVANNSKYVQPQKPCLTTDKSYVDILLVQWCSNWLVFVGCKTKGLARNN